MEPRPILCICTRYSLGGAPMNAKMLTEQFRLRGYPASAWYLMNVASEVESSSAVRVFHDHVPPIAYWPKMLFDARREIIRARPRAIFGFHPLANILGAVSARGAGANFVATQRNPANSQTRALAEAEKWLGSRDYYRANIAVSQSVATSYSAYPDSYTAKMKVIHNALPPLPLVEDDMMAARRAIGLPEGTYLIGSLGRLADQKNIEFLLDVMPLLSSGVLVIAGEGPNEAGIRAKIDALGLQDRVLMLGPLKGRDVSLFYTAIDVFAMPSRFEGFGRALVEAMSCGKPVIASDLDVIREVSRGAATVLPFDAARWADAIRDAQNMTDTHLQLVRQRSREVAQCYSMEAMVDAYLATAGLPPVMDATV